MHKLTKKFVAILCGIATLVGPSTALAEGTGFCTTYMQVRSGSTGGEYVGGLLKGQIERETVTERYLNSTVESEINGGGVVVKASSGGSISSGDKMTITETFDIGFYQMNDGSVWEVNCDNGDIRRHS
jgi:hypothetical protein